MSGYYIGSCSGQYHPFSGSSFWLVWVVCSGSFIRRLGAVVLGVSPAGLDRARCEIVVQSSVGLEELDAGGSLVDSLVGSLVNWGLSKGACVGLALSILWYLFHSLFRSILSLQNLRQA